MQLGRSEGLPTPLRLLAAERLPSGAVLAQFNHGLRVVGTEGTTIDVRVARLQGQDRGERLSVGMSGSDHPTPGTTADSLRALGAPPGLLTRLGMVNGCEHMTCGERNVRAATAKPEPEPGHPRITTAVYASIDASHPPFAHSCWELNNSRAYGFGCWERRTAGNQSNGFNYPVQNSWMSVRSKSSWMLTQIFLEHSYHNGHGRLNNWSPREDLRGRSACPEVTIGFTSGGISISLPTPVCRSGTDMRVDPKTYSNRWYHSYGAWRTDRSVDAIDQVNVPNGQNSGYYFRYDVDTRFV